MGDRLIVTYDEDCGFCRWSAGRLRDWDRHRRLRVASIQASSHLLDAVPVPARLEAMHVVDVQGRVFTGGVALARLLCELPGGWALAELARRAPDSTERFYRALARRRAFFGRWLGEEACRVDPAHEP